MITSTVYRLACMAMLPFVLTGFLALYGCDRAADTRHDDTVPAQNHDGHDHDEEPGHEHDDGHAHDEHDDHEHPEHAPGDGHAHNEDSHEGHDHGDGELHDDEHSEEEHVDEVTLTPDAVRRSGIRVARAKRQTLSATITAPARIAYNAEKIAHIGSTVTGRVKKLNVRIGDAVEVGALLAIIDSPELGEAQSDFLQKRTAVEIAGPSVELTKDAYERANKLYEQNQGITLTEVQNRQREYQAAKGALLAAQTAATAAENKLHLWGMDQTAVAELATSGEIDPTYRIRAPISGRIVEREVTLGELVSPEKEKLMVIAGLDTVWVFVDVPEAKLAGLAVGTSVAISVPALGGEELRGEISYISPQLDTSTRTARVRVELANEDMKLLPGMFARAEVSVGDSTAAPTVAVPEEAIQTVEGAPAVFVPVEGKPSTFAKRQVAVGPSVSGMVPVLAGLDEGERYVVSESFILKADLGKAGAAHEH